MLYFQWGQIFPDKHPPRLENAVNFTSVARELKSFNILECRRD